MTAFDGVGAKNIHTLHEIGRFVDSLGKMDYAGEVAALRRMFETKLSTRQLTNIKKMLPKKRHEQFDEYVALDDGSA